LSIRRPGPAPPGTAAAAAPLPEASAEPPGQPEDPPAVPGT
jgi:hypothetical protein